MRRFAALGLAFGWLGCHEPFGDDEDDGGGFTTGIDEEEHGGAEESSSGSSDPGREPADAPAAACEPVAGPTCDEIYAPQVRGLSRGEVFAISADDGPSNLVFTHRDARRDLPAWEHPSLGTLWTWLELQITAPVAPEAAARLLTLVAALPEAPGAYSGYAEATIRVGDRQVCFGLDGACPAFDELLAFAKQLDDALLEAWWAQDTGYVFGYETIEFQDWPLDVDWGDGGRIDVDEGSWNAFQGGWFVHGDGRHAYVSRSCSGPSSGCTTWTIDVELATVRRSPLDADQHHALLEGLGLFPFPIAVQGEAYATVRDAHVLEIDDPARAGARWVVVLVIPNPAVAEMVG